MTKIKSLLLMASCLFMLAGCELDRKKVLTVEQLPEAAQTYIKENMGDAKVLYVKKERKNLRTWYEVRFDNQIELEFNDKGEIYDIDVED